MNFEYSKGELNWSFRLFSLHDASTEDPSKGGRQLKRTLSVRGVRAFFLLDPHAEVDAGSEHGGDVGVWVVGGVEGLSH